MFWRKRKKIDNDIKLNIYDNVDVIYENYVDYYLKLYIDNFFGKEENEIAENPYLLQLRQDVKKTLFGYILLFESDGIKADDSKFGELYEIYTSGDTSTIHIYEDGSLGFIEPEDELDGIDLLMNA